MARNSDDDGALLLATALSKLLDWRSEHEKIHSGMNAMLVVLTKLTRDLALRAELPVPDVIAHFLARVPNLDKLCETLACEQQDNTKEVSN